MARMRVRVSTAGGETLEVETENGTKLGEIIQALKAEGFSFGSKVSVGGMPCSEDYIPDPDDVIATHDTPSGN